MGNAEDTIIPCDHKDARHVGYVNNIFRHMLTKTGEVISWITYKPCEVRPLEFVSTVPGYKTCCQRYWRPLRRPQRWLITDIRSGIFPLSDHVETYY